jgi:hypothetical protein
MVKFGNKDPRHFGEGIRMTELFLHLGPGKTGTTSLQNALYANRSSLIRDGILYPVFPVARTADSHHVLQALCKAHGGIEPYWSQGRERLDLANYGNALYSTLLEGVKKSSATSAILSSELLLGGEFFGIFASMLKRDFRKIMPIIYIRDPIPLYQSQFQQVAKRGGFKKTIEKIGPTVQKMEEFFGKNIKYLKYFERCIEPTWSIVPDFWRNVFDIDPTHLDSVPKENVADFAELTLTLVTVSFFYKIRSEKSEKRFGEVFERISYLRNGALQITNFDITNRKTSKLLFSEEIQNRILMATRDDRNWLEHKMLGFKPKADVVSFCDNNKVEIFKDIDELFRHSVYNIDVCFDLVQRLIDWMDEVIKLGDRSERAFKLSLSLLDAQHFISDLRT